MRGLLMLSLGAAALGAVALVPVSAWAGHGHWHGGHGHWRGGRGWARAAGVGARASMSVPPTADAGRQVMVGSLAAAGTISD
jgi:hypothetical protein